MHKSQEYQYMAFNGKIYLLICPHAEESTLISIENLFNTVYVYRRPSHLWVTW